VPFFEMMSAHLWRSIRAYAIERIYVFLWRTFLCTTGRKIGYQEYCPTYFISCKM